MMNKDKKMMSKKMSPKKSEMKGKMMDKKSKMISYKDLKDKMMKKRGM